MTSVDAEELATSQTEGPAVSPRILLSQRMRYAPVSLPFEIATNIDCSDAKLHGDMPERAAQRCDDGGGEFSDLVAELKNLPPLSPPRRWGKWPVANLEDAAKRV